MSTPKKPFLFILNSGPENASRVVRCFQLARLAAYEGHPVTVFLMDDATYLCNPTVADRITAPTGDSMCLHIVDIRFKELPVKIKACKPCCEARNIDTANLPPLFEIGTGPEAVALMAGDAVTVTF